MATDTPAPPAPDAPPPCPDEVLRWCEPVFGEWSAVDAEGRLLTWLMVDEPYWSESSTDVQRYEARRRLAAALAESRRELAAARYETRWQAGVAMDEAVGQAKLTLARNAKLREMEAALRAAESARAEAERERDRLREALKMVAGIRYPVFWDWARGIAARALEPAP